MRETVWQLMVAVQQARRGRQQRATNPPPAPRRKRPTTLRSIRSLIVDDHYALLAEGGY
jgi:hypothetical protein